MVHTRGGQTVGNDKKGIPAPADKRKSQKWEFLPQMDGACPLSDHEKYLKYDLLASVEVEIIFTESLHRMHRQFDVQKCILQLIKIFMLHSIAPKAIAQPKNFY